MDKQLNLRILEAIKIIAEETEHHISYEVLTVVEKPGRFKKEGMEMIDINIKLTKAI